MAAMTYDPEDMEPKVLAESLTRHAECKKDGQRFQVPEGLALSLFVTTGQETLVIDKVREVLLEEGAVVVASTSRGERFVLLCQDVRAVRVTGGSGATPGYT